MRGMSFTKPGPAFDAAASAAQDYVADRLGSRAAAQLHVRPFDAATMQAVAQEWMHAASGDHARLRRYIIHSTPVLTHLNRQADGKAKAPAGAFAAAFWMGERLCGVSFGGTPAHHILPVAYVFGRPGEHDLKGHVLACTHAAATAFARESAASCVVYSGPLSSGSVRQVERGAMALSLGERNNMWAGANIITPVDARQIPAGGQHVPGHSPLPPYVAEDYERAYLQLFGRAYIP